ncbi:MAG: alpha/beta hydrolase fold domain-containing protein, partial [Acetanaerobacterium sp.]
MTWFAKHGYAVASVDYSVNYSNRWPQPMEDIKQAIRWLRAHAEEFNLDPDRIAVMGESAGGHLAALTGLVNDDRYDAGNNLDQSSAVQAVIPWYAPVSPVVLQKELVGMGCTREMLPADIENYDNLLDLVSPGMPPFLILHGATDHAVQLSHGENLHDALEKAGNDVEMYIIEGADHADERFIQPRVKEIILLFLNEKLC